MNAPKPQQTAGSVCMRVSNLTVVLAESGEPIVRDVSFELTAGQIFALVGESGSGKSVTSLAAMRLLPDALKISGGSVDVEGTDLFALSEARMQEIRGRKVAMIFQNAMSALNPVQTVGAQVAETLKLHTPLRGAALRQRVVQLFTEVGIPDPEQRFGFFPHQLSGGQQQRVMIAMALACEPDVLIADEPTTALDVTIQLQVLNLIRELTRSRQLAVLLITHDMGVVRNTADEVAVMYRGELIERASVDQFFHHPQPQADRCPARPRALSRGGGGRTAAGAEGCQGALPHPPGPAAAHCGSYPGRGRRFPGDWPRRDLRPGGGVRQRQVHTGPGDSQPGRHCRR